MNASMRTYSQVGPIDGGVFKGERKTEMMKRWQLVKRGDWKKKYTVLIKAIYERSCCFYKHFHELKNKIAMFFTVI